MKLYFFEAKNFKIPKTYRLTMDRENLLLRFSILLLFKFVIDKKSIDEWI
jgi:hypothetical protein